MVIIGHSIVSSAMALSPLVLELRPTLRAREGRERGGGPPARESRNDHRLALSTFDSHN